MTKAVYHSYRFDTQHEPSDEQLGQLMENAAEQVRKTNRENDKMFFEELRRASEDAKKRNDKKVQL